MKKEFNSVLARPCVLFWLSEIGLHSLASLVSSKGEVPQIHLGTQFQQHLGAAFELGHHESFALRGLIANLHLNSICRGFL